MLFNSLEFLIFFPVVLIIYFAVPKKIKNIWLLIASYYFYMCWNAKYAVLILFSTIITFFSGILIEKVKRYDFEREDIRVICKKIIVLLSFAINLAILFYFKYINFALGILQDIFSVFSVQLNTPAFDIVLPVGISFYTFQALSYTMDVYRDDIYAEKNFFRYALFVSFFPQLVAGPIERSKNLLCQLAEPKRFDFDKAYEGFLLMLWGWFLKIVVADRIAIFVDNIYGNYYNFDGTYLIVATILFAIQIYCDFSGYSIIAIGAAKFLGINLMENFDAPYFATSVSDFWRRWHISLTSWFKDYLYIPLGGSRKGKFRKYINKMIVFLVSGLWHGAKISFIAWGGINGLYQIMEEVTAPLRAKVVEKYKININNFSHRLFQTVITFIMVDFSWIFFRADSFTSAVKIIERILNCETAKVLFDGSLYECGLDEKNFWFMIISIILIIFADYCKTKGIKIRDFIMNQSGLFQVLFVSFSIVAVLTFGVYGVGVDKAAFIYFQF